MASSNLTKNVRFGQLNRGKWGQPTSTVQRLSKDRRCAMKTLTSFAQMTVVSFEMAIALAILLFGCVVAAEGQPPAGPPTAGVPHATLHNIQPYYPSRPVYYAPRPFYPGWWGGYHASTAAESYARGWASVVRAQGQYNLLTAEARVVHSEAERREIENREQRIDSYFAMREKNRQERAAERGPRPTVEQLRRIASASKPAMLSPNEVDTRTGAISWPTHLQGDEYRDLRADLESLFAQRAAEGQLAPAEVAKAKQAADAMLEELKTQVRQIPQQDYIAARRFVESLAYAVQQPAS